MNILNYLFNKITLRDYYKNRFDKHYDSHWRSQYSEEYREKMRKLEAAGKVNVYQINSDSHVITNTTFTDCVVAFYLNNTVCERSICNHMAI